MSSVKRRLAAFAFCALLFCGAGRREYDSFSGFTLSLSLPQNHYQAGDGLELQFVIHSEDVKPLRLFNEKWRSLFLSVMPLPFEKEIGENQPSFQPYSGRELLETVTVSPDQPYRLEIHGEVIQDEKTERMIFDFRDFGKFEMRKAASYRISGHWFPVNPHPLDSLEDFTNPVILQVD